MTSPTPTLGPPNVCCPHRPGPCGWCDTGADAAIGKGLDREAFGRELGRIAKGSKWTLPTAHAAVKQTAAAAPPSSNAALSAALHASPVLSKLAAADAAAACDSLSHRSSSFEDLPLAVAASAPAMELLPSPTPGAAAKTAITAQAPALELRAAHGDASSAIAGVELESTVLQQFPEAVRSKILASFRKTVTDDMRHVKEAAERHDYKRVWKHVHTIKGGAGIVGATSLVRACEAMRGLPEKREAWAPRLGWLFTTARTTLEALEAA